MGGGRCKGSLNRVTAAISLIGSVVNGGTDVDVGYCRCGGVVRN